MRHGCILVPWLRHSSFSSTICLFFFFFFSFFWEDPLRNRYKFFQQLAITWRGACHFVSFECSFSLAVLTSSAERVACAQTETHCTCGWRQHLLCLQSAPALEALQAKGVLKYVTASKAFFFKTPWSIEIIRANGKKKTFDTCSVYFMSAPKYAYIEGTNAGLIEGLS